jgi:hypothetical protein
MIGGELGAGGGGGPPEKGGNSEGGTGWRWAQPNVSTYAALVKGLAASLCVADAIQMVANVRRRGIPAGDEVYNILAARN